MKKYLYCAFLIIVFGFGVTPAHAYAKSYLYERIDADVVIHTDTTFTVRETQTYRFDGEFHKGERSIPLGKADDVRDISVIDASTGKPLIYSSVPLDATQSSSSGYFTFYKKNGNLNIEWYHISQNETRSWVITYTVVGGLSFYTDHDELYWNILTEYSVPILSSHVRMTIPAPARLEDMRVTEYLDGGASSSSNIVDDRRAEAEALDMRPQAKFTVAFGWPKGIVDQRQYWSSFLEVYWKYIASGVIWLCTIIFCVWYWFFTERWKKGRGTIVAEYEPPQGLPPAMGEVITKEKTTSATWPATIVDLAVRGFVRIEEEEEAKFVWLRKTGTAFILGILIFVAVGLNVTSLYSYLFVEKWYVGKAIFLAVMLFVVGNLLAGLYKVFTVNQKDYRLILQREKYEQNLATIRPYEKELVEILFFYAGIYKDFSTREIRKDSLQAQKVHMLFTQLDKVLVKDVSALGVYEGKKTLQHEIVGRIILIILFPVVIITSFIFFNPGPTAVLASSAVGASILILYFIFFEARLNQEGNEERQQWLGFRLYLHTAERYRMQNLTPDMFEKYLPYAMIFGVEKQWAKTFEGIVSAPPSWYASPSSSGSSFSSVASFSAGAFSASLSSSLSSSMGSAGGGASGGGGSAGGGGGGGGGGAS